MIEQELIDIWKNSPRQEQVKFEKSRLIIDVQSNMDRFHRKMKTIYIRESLAAIILIPVFIYYAFIIPYILTKIASVLSVVWAIHILFIFKKIKEKEPKEYTTNYLDYLYKMKDYIEAYKKLQDNILSRVLIPFFVSFFLFMLGIALNTSNKISYFIGMVAFGLLLTLAIYFLNKKSAKKYVEPRLKRVKSLINTLEE